MQLSGRNTTERHSGKPCSSAAHRRSRGHRIARSHSTQAHCSNPTATPEREPAVHLACSLRALADTREVEAYAYWKVAAQLWPSIVVGPAALYVRYLQRVWEAARAPVDGVMLARVLAEEGVIGGRSVKGRQGPIVGVAPKRTRPLNAVEIVENWDILCDACTVKHNLRTSAERSAVRDAVAQALCEALPGVEDVPVAPPQAFASVQQAFAASRTTLCVLSPYPQPLTRAVLSRCGYAADHLHVASVSGVGTAQDLAAPRTDGVPPHIHVVMDSYSALRRIKGRLLGKGGTDAFRHSLQSQWVGSDADGLIGHPQPAVKLHMCDWALRSPAMRAQASGDAAMHVLTDVGLADLLGVQDVDAVMDGVSWR